MALRVGVELQNSWREAADLYKHVRKKCFIKILSSKTTIFSVVWFMDLVEDCVGTACGSLNWW